MKLFNRRKKATGVGKGFSAFLGLSNKNYMWIATLDPSSKNLVDEQRILFNEGDVLILPFGTVHFYKINLDAFIELSHKSFYFRWLYSIVVQQLFQEI